MPVSTRLATRLPRAMSLVNTEPPNPKSESLASATASSSFLTRKKRATGPKNSSLKAGLSGLMSVGIVGCMNKPGRWVRFPPTTKLADLAKQLYKGRFRGQRAERRSLVHGVSWFKRGQRGLELAEKAVSQLFDDDESLGRDAALARVVHLAPDRPLDRLIEIGILEHDEGVAAAKLHRRLLQVLSRSPSNALAGFHAACQCHTFDPRVVDHAVHLIVRDQQVGISAECRTCLHPQLLKRDGALRNAACMFHHNDITRHQVGRGKARKLVVGKVPRLDAEEHAERAAFDFCFARTRLEVLWCEEAFGVFGIVVDDVRAEHHFAAGLVNELAHFERHRASELVDASAHNRGRFSDHRRSRRRSRVPPRLEAGCSGFKRHLELLVGEFLKRLQDLAVIGVNTLVSHGFLLTLDFIVRDRDTSLQWGLRLDEHVESRFSEFSLRLHTKAVPFCSHNLFSVEARRRRG